MKKILDDDFYKAFTVGFIVTPIILMLVILFF